MEVLPFGSDQVPCRPIMAGPVAPVVIAVDPPHPGGQPWQKHASSWLSRNPNFQGRETGWSVGPKPRVRLILAETPTPAHLCPRPTGGSSPRAWVQTKSLPAEKQQRAICLWAS